MTSSSVRLKRHYLYNELYKNCVNDLRLICRKNGETKWYKIKKHELICCIILRYCSIVITKLFKNKKTRENDKTWCPISLIPVDEITDPYVHDGVTFSRQYLIDYFNHSVNFTNPSTTSEFELNDIKRLKSEQLEKLFNQRAILRDEIVENVYTFNFLEDEIEDLLHSIIKLYLRRNSTNSYEFREARIEFHRIWLRLIELDKNRTICILRSLIHKCKRIYILSSSALNVSIKILTKYLSETEY